MDEQIIKILSILFLICGLLYAAAVLVRLYRERKTPHLHPELTLREEPGDMKRTMLYEFIVYFLCAVGFPDFVLNTIFFERSGLVRSDRLSQTLVMCTVTPSSIIVFSYLGNSSLVDLRTLLLSSLAVLIGGLIGSALAGRTGGELIRRILAIALVISMIAIIVRIILNSGTVGTRTAMTTAMLMIALPLFVLLGLFNAFGVPMKPTATAILLMMGISPMSTLTYMLVLTFIGPATGSVRYLQLGRFNRKFVLSALTGGVLGALIGTRLTLNLNGNVLTALMLFFMAFAFYTLIRKKN